MGLSDVRKEIESQAKSKASEIISRAKSEVDDIMKGIDAQVSEYRDRVEKETASVIEEIEKQVLSNAEMSARNKVMKAKKDIIETVMDQVKGRIREHDQKRYLEKLLEKCSKDLDVSFVYVNKEDVEAAGKLGSFAVKTEGIIGGIIAENKDQTIRLDESFDALLESIKDQELSEIGKRLFGK